MGQFDNILIGEIVDQNNEYSRFYLSVVFSSGKGREYPIFLKKENTDEDLKNLRSRFADLSRQIISGLVFVTESGGLVYLFADKLAALELLTYDELFSIKNLRIE